MKVKTDYLDETHVKAFSIRVFLNKTKTGFDINKILYFCKSTFDASMNETRFLWHDRYEHTEVQMLNPIFDDFQIISNKLADTAAVSRSTFERSSSIVAGLLA